MKTPSLTFPNFLSDLECKDENVLQIIENRINSCAKVLETHYNVKINLITAPYFSNDYERTCDSEAYYNYKFTTDENGAINHIGYKWRKFNEYDFTGYITLRQFNEHPYDITLETNSGVLSFENYGTSIYPKLGDLIVFPSSSNFYHTISIPTIGDFTYIKLFFVCKEPFEFNFRDFGNKPFTSIVNC